MLDRSLVGLLRGSGWVRQATSRIDAPKGAVYDLVVQASRRDAWGRSFGQPSEGLGQLVRDLPKYHPARQDLARMIREVRQAEVPHHTVVLGEAFTRN